MHRVTVIHKTESYIIDGLTLTAEQARQIASAYNEHQEYKSKGNHEPASFG